MNTLDLGEEIVIEYIRFIREKYGSNKKNIIGIIGCGNRNFNALFAQTAKKIAATLKVPILYLLEFSGTSEDVKNVRKIVHDFSTGESTKKIQKPKELHGNISFLSDFRD